MIGKQVINSISSSVRALLHENQQELDQAWLKSEGSLVIAVKVKMKPSSEVTGDIGIETNLSFVLERVRASMGFTVNESQGKLFEADDLEILGEDE